MLNMEKKLKQQRKLTGLLPGKLSLAGSERAIDCKPVDIAANGLGILSTERITPGSHISLTTHDQEIMLEVLWGQPDFFKGDLFRYGLVTVGHNNLEDIFFETGCLK